jgi:hypothetical protein
MTRVRLLFAMLGALTVGVVLTGSAASDVATPTIESSVPASPGNSTTPTLNGTAVAGATVNIYTDANCALPPVATGTADGQSGAFSLQVQVAADTLTTFYATASNASPKASPCSAGFAYQEDSTPPPAPTIDPNSEPPSLTSQTSANFSFSDSEGGVGFQCQLNGGGFSACPPASYSGLGDRSHTFEVKAIDGAGNSSDVASYTWTIDTTAPPAPTINNGPPNVSGSSDANFSFTDADPTVSFQCQLDGSPFLDCSSGSASYSDLEDGPHTFAVKAIDPLGHESDPTLYPWTIAHKAVTLSAKPPLVTNQTTASFSFSSEPPSNTYRCKLDAGSFAKCTSPKPYSGLQDGQHTFRVQIGNTGPVTIYTWTVDTIPPETAIASTPPASSSSASASFTFTSSEAASTFACSLDASGFSPCASPQTYAGLGDGTHTFRVQAVDAAGNADTTPTAYSWEIVGVGPATTDRTPPGNVKRLRRNVHYGMLKLAWARPSDSDFDHVKVLVSTSAKSPPRTLVYTGKAYGYTNKRFKNGLYYRYAVLSYDRAGNASRGAAVVVPPSILLRSPRDRAVVKSPPRLLWAPVPKATFYNVQLYSTNAKLLSAWPGKAKLTLTRRWTYAGRRFELKRGLYRWFVWPGFGPRAKARYGQLLGQGTFRVS